MYGSWWSPEPRAMKGPRCTPLGSNGVSEMRMIDGTKTVSLSTYVHGINQFGVETKLEHAL